MKIIELIPYLTDGSKVQSLYSDLGMEEGSEDMQIYMKDTLLIDSDVFLFEEEETNDYLEIEREGQTFIQFFAIDHAMDLIEYDLQLKGRGYTTTQIAERLLEYRINDA